MEWGKKEEDNGRKEKQREQTEGQIANRPTKCQFHEGNKCTNENCTFHHPKRVCKNYNQNKCDLGKKCTDNHPKKICSFWVRGYCNKDENYILKHGEQHRENNHKEEQPKTKEREQHEHYKTYIEELTNAVREGLKENNDL